MELYIGIIGMSLILIGFILNEFEKLKVGNKKYEIINLIGSLMLVYYAWKLNSIPFFILNAAWAIISLKGLIKS